MAGAPQTFYAWPAGCPGTRFNATRLRYDRRLAPQAPNHGLNEAIESVFDKWARTGKAAGMERRHKRLAELMFRRFHLPPDSRVLDIGCGDGWTARMMSSQLPDGAFVGIDLSREMIRSAREACAHLENALFAPGAADEIPWAEDYFTHALSIESAYYWPRPAMAAREIFRVTSYGGSFHILINYYQENEYSEGWDRDLGLRLHRLNAAQWESLFRECGFEEVQSERIPDDSPITPGKPPAERARREGLQREGALYVSGRKPGLPETGVQTSAQPLNPFRVLR